LLFLASSYSAFSSISPSSMAAWGDRPPPGA
jgi:hypothetical protein